MAKGGEQSRKPKPKKEDAQAAEAKGKAAATTEVDELLDEIDEVLETNAEDFVRSFVQKGGE